MATNGAYGFRKNGIEKLDYQHSDGWVQDGLGQTIIKFIKIVDTSKMVDCFDDIVVGDGGISFEGGDPFAFVAGEKTHMVDGSKLSTDFNYIMDLDKEVLEYHHFDIKFNIDFSFIKKSSISEVINFIKNNEFEKQFDELIENGFEEELNDKLKENNFFYLGPDNYDDIELISEKVEREELEDWNNDSDEQYVFVSYDGFLEIESFRKKIEKIIKNLEEKNEIKIAKSSYYTAPW